MQNLSTTQAIDLDRLPSLLGSGCGAVLGRTNQNRTLRMVPYYAWSNRGLNGRCFVGGTNPPHMVAFQHTITARKDLEKKWRHGFSKVKPQKDSKPPAPAGDLIKTAELVAEERTRTANLSATIVLTTNEELDKALVRDVTAAGRDHGIEIGFWSRSRLSDSLHHHPPDRGPDIRFCILSRNNSHQSCSTNGKSSARFPCLLFVVLQRSGRDGQE
jgi:hypothetical protein